MPSPADNSISDTPTTELIPSETAATASATPKWDKVEQERLTRRAALRKMGYTSGIALFSMFAVDDLARMAIKKMEEHKETRQIAETVAKEFQNSGIALAGPYSSNGCLNNGSVKPGCNGSDIGYNCLCCLTSYSAPNACALAACQRCYPNRNMILNYSSFVAYNQCVSNYQTYFKTNSTSDC